MDSDLPQGSNALSTTDRTLRWIIIFLQLILAVGLALAVYKSHWQNVITISGILLLIQTPTIIGKRYHLNIPIEFELMAIFFVFVSLFLGEIHGYYTRFWWWDIALHTTSGLLLGILGFLMVYVLNENDRIDMSLQPGFVALFAFMFATAIGALWEVFEFSMDQFFGMNMQKPMLNDPSGLTDTMWDLIVDMLGAAIVALVGWRYMRAQRQSIFARWIRKFIDSNPRLFNRQSRHTKRTKPD